VIEIGINQLPCSHKPKIGDLSLLAVEMLRLVKALRKLNGKVVSKINLSGSCCAFVTLGLSIVSGGGLGINLCFLMVEFRIGRDRCLGALNSRLREGKLKSRTINTHRTS
jgi:hypothetical protein